MGMGCRCLLALCIALLGATCSTATATPAAAGNAGGGALDNYSLFKANRFQSLVRSAVAASEANQALLATGVIRTQGSGPGRCRTSEFHCENTSHCIPLSKYCDRKIDCPDKSDEPASCSGEERPGDSLGKTLPYFPLTLLQMGGGKVKLSLAAP